jgi:hypothetical protein
VEGEREGETVEFLKRGSHTSSEKQGDKKRRAKKDGWRPFENFFGEDS